MFEVIPVGGPFGKTRFLGVEGIFRKDRDVITSLVVDGVVQGIALRYNGAKETK